MRAKQRRHPGPPFDLFGEIPVTWSDVIAWCAAVPGIAPDSWRFGYYVRGWNVPEKIRQAKLAGTFESITAEACYACGALSATSSRRAAPAPNRSPYRR